MVNKMDNVKIMSKRIMSLQVCAESSLSKQEIEDIVNNKESCGTSAGWKIPTDHNMAFYKLNHTNEPCDKHKDRTHWILGA